MKVSVLRVLKSATLLCDTRALSALSDASDSCEMLYQECHKAISVLLGLLITLPEEMYQGQFCRILQQHQ